MGRHLFAGLWVIRPDHWNSVWASRWQRGEDPQGQNFNRTTFASLGNKSCGIEMAGSIPTTGIDWKYLWVNHHWRNVVRCFICCWAVEQDSTRTQLTFKAPYVNIRRFLSGSSTEGERTRQQFLTRNRIHRRIWIIPTRLCSQLKKWHPWNNDTKLLGEPCWMD
jgi:hypothetical protein